jgi:hypothetical protein
MALHAEVDPDSHGRIQLAEVTLSVPEAQRVQGMSFIPRDGKAGRRVHAATQQDDCLFPFCTHCMLQPESHE